MIANPRQQPVGRTRMNVMRHVKKMAYGGILRGLESFAPLFGMPAKTLQAMVGEMAAFNDSGNELRAATIPAELPLVIFMHGQRILPEGPWGDKIEQQWLELQRELASRHPNSTFIIARESGYNILFDQPEVIVPAVRQLLAGGAGTQR